MRCQLENALEKIHTVKRSAAPTTNNRTDDKNVISNFIVIMPFNGTALQIIFFTNSCVNIIFAFNTSKTNFWRKTFNQFNHLIQ